VLLPTAILAALGLLLALLLLARRPQVSRESDPPPPRDPIVETVEKWAHDWERGRA
jgi:hypothetical protein